MKLPKAKRILAINPGVRYMGVAVFENNQPVYWAVKGIRMNQSAKKRIEQAKRITQNLIDYYQPEMLAIEKPLSHWIKQSKLLDKIILAVKNTAKGNKMMVKEFTPEEVRKGICGNSKATREELAEILLLKYPDLKNVLNEKKIKDRYGGHLAGAVILGILTCISLKKEIKLNKVYRMADTYIKQSLVIK